MVARQANARELSKTCIHQAHKIKPTGTHSRGEIATMNLPMSSSMRNYSTHSAVIESSESPSSADTLASTRKPNAKRLLASLSSLLGRTKAIS